MKKLILLLLMVCSFSLGGYAQSMSDDDIIEFVQKEQKKGTSQAQIVTKLMQKGVSVTRLQQLRRKQQALQKGSKTMGGTDKGEVTDRLRTPNGTSLRGGDKIQEETDFQNNTMNGLRNQRPDNVYEDDFEDDEFEDEEEMQKELDGILPDSMKILEKKIERRLRNKKKVFGRNIFNNRYLTFEPNMNIATPKNYVLGAGDAVNIDIYGATQKTFTETISPDGSVTLEDYGPVNLAGLTVAQANARLRSTLGARYSSSRIQLTVGQTKTIMVNIMGEVKAPGTYTLSAFASVFHALYMAGGVSDIGTLRDIKVYRRNKLVSSVDIYDYILNGKLSGNIKLTDNDVIVVGPYDCLVNVTGKVKRPMYYEMKKTESVGTLLKYAGGFTGDAYKKSVRLMRKNGKEYGVYNVGEFDMGSFNVADGDSVSVDSIRQRYENTVEVKGAVFRPGMYHLGNEITTVRSLISAAEGVTEDAMSQHIILHRMKEDRTLEAMALNLKGIMDGSLADVPLKNEDQIFVPSKKEIIKEQVLKVYGEVQYPGTYQYAEGSTVEDIILQAGGMKNSSSTKVTVTRRIVDSSSESGVSVKTFEMELKDGFVIDGETGFKLEPFDEVFVNRNPLYKDMSEVTISGEVMAEGAYGIEKGKTRVSDILKMAGGVTSLAADNGAYILRKMTDDEKQMRQKRLDAMRSVHSYNIATTQGAGMNEKFMAADSLLVEQNMRSDYYKVAVNLKASINHPGSTEDVLLRGNDQIVVEERINTVKITGSVPYENDVPYVKGKSANYYLSQGGVRGARIRKTAYVVYQNGAARMVKDGAEIEPGCSIVVPEKDLKNNQQTNTSQIFVSIASTIATMCAVLISALK